MFLSLDQIRLSLEALEPIHPFFGITFLVSKAGKLPIGGTTDFPFDAKERTFLGQYYKPATDSKFYYRVFRPSNKPRRWLSPKYASSGSQSTRTRGDLATAFIHTKDTSIWGWKPDYVSILSSFLSRQARRIPAFALAVWLYRERKWAGKTTAKEVISTFFKEFSITKEERDLLFDISVPETAKSESLLVARKVTWEALQTITGKPPDAPPEEGGTLAYLELRGVGPARQISFEPGERLNLITGDNALGKSFLLECAWWALTGYWAGLPAYPRQGTESDKPEISFQIAGETVGSDRVHLSYNWNTQSWPSSEGRPTIPGLLIYARVDGSFGVWDPAKGYWASAPAWKEDETAPGLFVFGKEDVWEGLVKIVGGKTQVYSNGLLRDWITWQLQQDKYPFDTFKRVLRRLSPDELGPLEPGRPVRLPYDAREIPTLRHSYGEVPIVHAAAGIRRIVAIAYLIVWAWQEHKTQSELIHREPQKRMVVLVDEMEAHLHPKWQRVILPALLDVSEDLGHDLQVQFLVATHSPLVMASAESRFDREVDKLFHLDLTDRNLFETEVVLKELDFVKYGPVDAWLVSEVFELRHARSREAEEAIERAKTLQSQEKPKPEEVQSVSAQLVKHLSAHDEFWPRWKYFAEQHGVHM